MANIKADLIEVNKVPIHKEVNKNFQLLVTALKKDRGLSLTLKSSYLSSYDIVDDLRKKINPTVYTNETGSIKDLLDPAIELSTFAQDEAKYTALKDYIKALPLNSFEPPLGALEPSLRNVSIAPIPHYLATDPRGYGLLITPNDDELKQELIKDWLLNNSVLYGFVLYSDHSLFHMGKEVIKTQLSTAAAGTADNLLKEIVSKYLPSTTGEFTLTQTAKTVIEYVPPAPTPAPPAIISPDAAEIVLPMYTKRDEFRSIVLHHTEGFGKAPKIRLMFKGAREKTKAAVIATAAEISVGENNIGGYFNSSSKSPEGEITDFKLSIAESAYWGGMNLFIGFDGVTEKAKDIYRYMSVNGSNKLNQYGIGIELGSIGALEGYNNGSWRWPKSGNKSLTTGYSFWQYTPGTKRVVDLGFKYNDVQYWDDFSEKQIAGLRDIITEIMNDTAGGGDKIRDAVKGQNVYSMVFGINPDPTAGGNIAKGDKLTDYDGYGIYTHNRGSGAGGHSDTFPSPSLVQMLIDNFGMVGNIPTPIYYSFETGEVIQ